MKSSSLLSKQLSSKIDPLQSLFKNSSSHEQLNTSLSFLLVHFGGL